MKTLKQALYAGTARENEPGPFIIAEMSGNHNSSLDRALAIVDAAAASGVDAIKLQTFTPDSMTLNVDRDEFKVTNPKSPWYGRMLYDLYAEGQTPRDWHEAIFARAKSKGIICFSSPFDESAVDFLDELGAPAFKIASFENVDLPLIQYAASKGKPLIISTGMAKVGEIEAAVDTALSAGCKQLTILKCTSSYPTPVENANLLTIPHMSELFACQVGLSDHTLGIGAPIAATALGATVIEKHFVLSRAEGGIDSAFSLEPAEFESLVNESRVASLALGDVSYGPTQAEEAALEKRRSIYIVADLKAGDVLTTENLRRIRPGLGMAPKYWDEILGRTLKQDVTKGTPMSWDLIS